MFLDLHKTFVDDESYNSGHGHAYEKYGVDVKEGAVAVVRPDQCSSPYTLIVDKADADAFLDVSLVTSLDDKHGLMSFFEGWVVPPPQERTEQ